MGLFCNFIVSITYKEIEYSVKGSSFGDADSAFLRLKHHNMKALNLFGEMQDVPDFRSGHQSAYQITKARNKYRLAGSKTKSCKTCINCVYLESNSYKKFYKCKLIGISSSEATDIRLKNTCDKHEIQ
ncbi:MAG: hypothetical protein DRH90_24885 [Deltaproteobacteria bacterium]|nr:MAG: hypothetical protein DRH90_24885 [Deltaproteobacteria bacterium]